MTRLFLAATLTATLFTALCAVDPVARIVAYQMENE